jgi:hypothetical protein
MLEAGDRIPEARVWTAPRQDPVSIGDALAGDDLVFLCFYFFDWSPG